MSPVQHPVNIYHGVAKDGRTLCGRPTEGKHITHDWGYMTCVNCRAVYSATKTISYPSGVAGENVPPYGAVIESQEVEMSQSFTHRQVAEVFASRVSRISSSAANEVNEYLRAADDDRGQYLFTLRRLAAEMHTLIDSIWRVASLIANTNVNEEFLAKSRYWLLRSLRDSVNSTISEIEAN